MSEHYSLRESIFLQEGHKRRLPRQAFSLTELIVVIAVISVVLGILVPVVQSIRESARNTSCKNHLRELGHGFLRHEASTGRFISGGWSPLWLGVILPAVLKKHACKGTGARSTHRCRNGYSSCNTIIIARRIKVSLECSSTELSPWILYESAGQRNPLDSCRHRSSAQREHH